LPISSGTEFKPSEREQARFFAKRANVTVNTEYARCTNNKCNDALHRHAITTHSQIVEALVAATKLSVPRIQSNSLRPFWNSELDDLKNKSIFWHHVWKDAGCPASGWLHNIKSSCKFKYKLAVRHAFREFEHAHMDEINELFVLKYARILENVE